MCKCNHFPPKTQKTDRYPLNGYQPEVILSEICGGCATCCASVPAENIAGVNLVHDIIETGVVAVGNDNVREPLEFGKVSDH